jgi:hypothetical protein
VVAVAAPLLVAGCADDGARWQKLTAQAWAERDAMNQSHMDGELRLNEAPFRFRTCTPGGGAFRGVELEGADGARLRLVAEDDGRGSVIQLRTDAEPRSIRACGKIALEPSRPTSDARGLRGVARLDCTSGALRVTGSVSFNCVGARGNGEEER